MNPILIMDSGVGGLTVFEEIKQLMPWLPVVYCADNAAFPYGPRPQSEVVERVSLCLKALCKKYNPRLAVIACNTASTVALAQARKDLSIPVVGVVPAIKTAASLSQNHCIGLLATPGTVKRPYTDDLVENFAQHCTMIRVGSTRLVHIAEEKLRGMPVKLDELTEILSPFFKNNHEDNAFHNSTLNKSTLKKNNPDHIVLGCTHFPLLKDELSLCAPSVTWVDSGIAIARRVKALLKGEPEYNHYDNTQPPTHIALFTAEDSMTELYKNALKVRNFQKIEFLLAEIP